MRGYRVSGHGPGVVLLHSSLSSSAQWKRLAAQLERGYHVLAVDLLGYGEAPAVADAEGYSLRDETARVLGLADAWFGRGARFHVVGHSYGGLAALARAIPGAALAWIEGGHMAPVTSPDQFNLMLGSFLDWTAPVAKAA